MDSIQSRFFDSGELKKLDKIEKAHIVEVHATHKDIRTQLNEQLKCLDSRLESQQSQVVELQDIFRRRAEIEMNYARDLDKLSRLVVTRHKEQKAKREGWSSFSSTEVWKNVVSDTRKVGRDHAALAEIFSNNVGNRLNNLNEDLARIYKKCKEVGLEIHEGVLHSLYELHTAMKTHHTYQSEFRQAEAKLSVVERQRIKLKEGLAPEKLMKSRKYRLIGKDVIKRTEKYQEASLKAAKASNDYLLTMDAANASVHKYFVDDLSDLMDCMDLGFHQTLARAMRVKSSALDQMIQSHQLEIDGTERVLSGLDCRLDKKKFLERNESAFALPKRFEYQPVVRREEGEITPKIVEEELEVRKQNLAIRIQELRGQSEKVWNNLEKAEKSLVEIVTCKDTDTSKYFTRDGDPATTPRSNESDVEDEQRQQTEQLYLDNFKQYILNSNRISRLQAKYDNIRERLGDRPSFSGLASTLPRPTVSTRRRIGRSAVPVGVQPKLFGGSLEEYLEAVHQDIPNIIKSCIRMINLFGLHHQGIFRVSGSKVEINKFRDAFERGDDPLADMTDASDINSVGGVLKLYLRELREPLFTVQYFDQLMDLAKLESKHEFVMKVREVVKTWPRKIFTVVRYIFAFLHHLSEYSDENMMDPYNLAICFGPTLVPIPPDRDQVQHQNLVNELIKNFIIFHEDIFPDDGVGTVYEKYISSEPDLVGEYDTEDTDDHHGDEVDLELETADEELLEAQAQYDFTARSEREVSFTRGDNILLSKQVSGDWWKGVINGREGLIPDKYILLKIRGDDEGREHSVGREIQRRISREEVDPVTQITPPLSRSVPYRHSISTPGPVASRPPQVIKPGVARSLSRSPCRTPETPSDSSVTEQVVRAHRVVTRDIEDRIANRTGDDLSKSNSVENSLESVGARIDQRVLSDSNANVGDNKDNVFHSKVNSDYGNDVVDGVATFARKKRMWEKRASMSANEEVKEEDPKFPDLVKDLPSSQLQTPKKNIHHTPSNDSLLSSSSSSATASLSSTTADNFVADTDTLKKLSDSKTKKESDKSLVQGLTRQPRVTNKTKLDKGNLVEEGE